MLKSHPERSAARLVELAEQLVVLLAAHYVQHMVDDIRVVGRPLADHIDSFADTLGTGVAVAHHTVGLQSILYPQKFIIIQLKPI